MHIHIFWDALSPAGLQLPVARIISAMVGVRVTVAENNIRMSGYVQSRKQIDAKVLLDGIQSYKHRHAITNPILLIVPQDLFCNGHSFVFGLAREPAGAAVVSAARLANEYYGREKSDDDLTDRLAKEGAHEIGHLFSLPHCSDPECIMFRPDTLDELDRKKKQFCSECATKLYSRFLTEGS
jgi:archaemetzincin